MKKGQILLITVMILATVLTVVLSVSFRSVTETQITKLEEENQKALAAAEAAIEAALNSTDGSATIGAGSLSNITGFSGSATLDTTTSNSFTTAKINKDSSYTFYLGDYDLDTYTIGASSQEAIEICFQTDAPNPAIEITLVRGGSIKKYVVDPDSRINNADTPSSICSNNSYNYSYTVPAGVGDINTNSKFLLVRVLYQETKLYFKRSSNFPLQGKTIASEATSTTGVSKKITLFQTYPQIPAEFFTTTF